MREAFERRGLMYKGLFVLSMLLFFILAFDNPKQGCTAGFAFTGVSKTQYALTQCEVIPYYLRLAFWPDQLCIDYYWPFVNTLSAVWPGALLLALMLAATILGLARRAPWSFLGAWFFLILAPTSSILPIKDAIFEHRMYLPLAALAAAFVIAVAEGARWIAEAFPAEVSPSAARGAVFAAFAAAALALGIRTHVRNCDYYSDVAIWRSAVARFPHAPRANNNLGNALANEEKNAESIPYFEIAAKYDSSFADPQFNLGVVNSNLNRHKEAVEHFNSALQINANYPRAHLCLGDIYYKLGRHADAIAEYELELKRLPAPIDPQHKELLGRIDDVYIQWNESGLPAE
jgi:tetratricopeptide (TPR) repeat protein